eukprot:5188840-Amphidinium_carterae.2
MHTAVPSRTANTSEPNVSLCETLGVVPAEHALPSQRLAQLVCGESMSHLTRMTKNLNKTTAKGRQRPSTGMLQIPFVP